MAGVAKLDRDIRVAGELNVRILCILVAVFCGLYAPAALAQWNPHFTASLGRSYGQLALSQSTLSGTRRIQGDATAPPPADSDPLTFTPDPELTSEIRAGVIDILSQQSPELRAQMERTFAGDAVLKDFERYQHAHGGYSANNVADSQAALLVVSWEIMTNSTASAAQVRGAHAQVRTIFLNTPTLRELTNAGRQEMAERNAYQVMISVAARDQYLRKPEPARLTELRASATTVMKQQGIDLSELKLTDQGFKKS
jgi:hypothetical protein